MEKAFNNLWLRAFMLTALMLTTSLVVQADYKLMGSFDNWSQGVLMTEENGTYVAELNVAKGQEFKILNTEGNVWLGGDADSRNVTGIPWVVNTGAGDNIVFSNASGWIKFTFTPVTNKLDLSYVTTPRTVAVATGLANGTITTTTTQASAGTMVNFTVTPNEGYWADKSHITAYATIPPSYSKTAPDLGEELIILGDAIASHDQPGTFSFFMPEYPKGAYVANVDFQACTQLEADWFLPIGARQYTGEAITPTPIPTDASGLTSNDFTVVGYENNVEVGTATVIVKGKGKYTGEVRLTFTIEPIVYHITYVSVPTEGGTITGPDGAIKGATVIATITPNEGYQFDRGTYAYNGGTFTFSGTNFDFPMPESDVTITAYFSKIPQLYIATNPTDGSEEWPKQKMTKQDDGKWVIEITTTENLAFTFYDQDDTYYGSTSSGHWFDIDNNDLNTPLNLGANDPFYIMQPGTWTITVDADLTTVTVTGDWKYNVTTTVVGEGTLVANATTAIAGTTVEVTATPDTDYELASLKVTYGDQEMTPTLKEGETNVYVFTMPASDVTVTATYTKIPKLYLTGDFNNWGNNSDYPNVEFQKVAEDDGGYHWEISSIGLNEGEEFKFIDADGNWYGSNRWVSDANKVYIWDEAHLDQPVSIGTEGVNMKIFRHGTWKIIVESDLSAATVIGLDYAHLITVAEGQEYVNLSTTTAHKDTEVRFWLSNVPEGKIVENVSVTYTIDGTTVDIPFEKREYDTPEYVFTMPDYDVTVSVTVADPKFNIYCGEGVSIVVPEGTNQAAEGTEVTVQVTPNSSFNAEDFVAVGIEVSSQISRFTVTEANEDGTYSFTMPGAAVDVNPIYEAILHGVTFDGNHHWATYYGKHDLVAPENVEVYVVNEGYALGNEVPVTQVNYIPANVGVLLYCPNDMRDITTPLYMGDSEAYTSQLVGSVEDMTLNAYDNYVLYNDAFLLAEGGTLAAHRCYLPKPAGAQHMRLTLTRPNDGGIITAIEGIDASDVASVKYVNLSGMTSDKPFKGVNVVVITRNDGTTRTTKAVF